MTRARCRWIAAALAALGSLSRAAPARADRRPTLASDGFYVGARLDPGVAMLAGWDLDIYLSRSRMVSLGPGASLSVLGTAVSGGRQQDFLLTADVLRLKVGATTANGELRPFFLVGGGFSFVRLTDYVESNVTVTTPGEPAGVTHTGDQHYVRVEEFAPVVTVGAGTDLFTNGPIGITALLASHIRVVGSARMPDVWLDVAIGLRFGL